MAMPQTLTAPAGDLDTIARLRDLAPEIQAALEGISGRAHDPFLLAHLDGYRSRLRALADETAQLLSWIEPDHAKSVVPKRVEVPEIARRAKLAATRLKQRADVAALHAAIGDNRDAGFPSDASQKELDRMRADRVKLFGENNYVYGLAASHRLTTVEWHALDDAYRALATEANAWTKKTDVEAADADRIAALRDRFALAIAPCGHALSRDDDADWLASLKPPVEETKDLATVDDLRRAIHDARPTPAAPSLPTAPTGADRCRLKAEVARVKARLARAETRGSRDDDASLDLRKLQTRHRLEFHEDGYVFGFSAAHRLEPEEWEDLARAYDDVAAALDRGVDSEVTAEKAQEAVDRLREAIRPAGRALRHDDDADDLEDEIQSFRPQRTEAEDPLAPFLARLANFPEDSTAVAELAETILASGVRPSDPRLRDPFLDWADDLDAPTLEPFVRELVLERERRLQQEEEAEPATPDPVYLALRDKVREITRGKRLLMVGGLNREETRRAIETELGLAELFWPDSDEHKTKPAAFDAHVDRADVVVKNRFCRRGFQRALERAKAEGKPAVALLSGYSPRQVVRGIAEALRL